MIGPEKLKWLQGEVLADPQKMFVLWAVRNQFCVSREDFERHYGPDFPVQILIASLERDGFVKPEFPMLALTDAGEDAVRCLGGRLDSYRAIHRNLTSASVPAHLPSSTSKYSSRLTAESVDEWRPIDAGTGFDDCINFYGEFDSAIASQALAAIHTVIEESGNPCYCLRLQVDADNQGYFHSFGQLIAPAGVTVPPPESFGKVPLHRLVPDQRTWAPLAIRVGCPQSAADGSVVDEELKEFLKKVSWQVKIRLQDNETYVGYFKLVGMNGSPEPSYHDVLAAAYIAKLEVARLLAHRHVQNGNTDYEIKERLHETAAEIASASYIDGRLAVRHVADMLTSHLGAGWNRVACYCPVNEDTLRCIWAQGGGGDPDWCSTVQRPIGESVREVQKLLEITKGTPYPLDDVYYLRAAGESSIEISSVRDLANQNVLAQLWRANGNVRALPAKYQRWELSDAPIAHMSAVNRHDLLQQGPLAAEFDQRDPWVEQITRERSGDPIFSSQNGRYFALPWFARDELIGIWVVDMAYWSTLGGQPDAPSLALTAAILAALGPAMDRHRHNGW